MDEQPKPALRRTAARNPAKTAAARTPRAPAEAPAKTAAKAAANPRAKTAAKQPAKKRTPSKHTVAAAVTRPPSTSDNIVTLHAPPTNHPVETRPSERAAKTAEAPARTWDLIARLGPEARDWVARTRERYPAATPAALARLAAAQRRPGSWLVLAIAAAYGVDPTDPARAADLGELDIHSGRSGLEGRARARYSQETWWRTSTV